MKPDQRSIHHPSKVHRELERFEIEIRKLLVELLGLLSKLEAMREDLMSIEQDVEDFLNQYQASIEVKRDSK